MVSVGKVDQFKVDLCEVALELNHFLIISYRLELVLIVLISVVVLCVVIIFIIIILSSFFSELLFVSVPLAKSTFHCFHVGALSIILILVILRILLHLGNVIILSVSVLIFIVLVVVEFLRTLLLDIIHLEYLRHVVVY